MNYELNYAVVFLSLTLWPQFTMLYHYEPGGVLQKVHTYLSLCAEVQARFLHNTLLGSILKFSF